MLLDIGRYYASGERQAAVRRQEHQVDVMLVAVDHIFAIVSEDVESVTAQDSHKLLFLHGVCFEVNDHRHLG